MRLLFLFVILCNINLLYGQDIYSLENGKRFASYLFKKSDFELAAMEYERLLFLDPENDTLKLNLVASYRKAAQTDKAIKLSQKLYPSFGLYPRGFSINYVQLLLEKGQADGLNTFLYEQESFSDNEVEIIEMYDMALSKDWKGAYLKIQGLNERGLYQNETLIKLLAKGSHTKFKKPLLATSFSIFLPGSGKFYTKDWKDGLLGLVMIGGSAFQSYRGFDKGGVSSVQGWIFGGVAAGFYGGNIYGSYKAAQNYNDRLNRKMHQDAKEVIFNSFNYF